VNHASLVWASLRRRPLQTLLGLTSTTLAFTLFGLALGIAEGLRLAAGARDIALDRSVLLAAIAIATVSMLLILLLTTAAMAHAIRARRQELGVLIALGFSYRRIFELIAAETVTSCVSGALFGLATARVLFVMLAGLLPALKVVPVPVYTTGIILSALAAALAIAIVSASLPMLRIMQLDAAAALHDDGNVPAWRGHDGQERAAPDRTLTPPGERMSSPAIRATDLLLGRQIWIVSRIGLSTLRQRLTGGFLITAGVGCVAFALLSFLSALEGIRVGLLHSGDPARVVLRATSSTRLSESRVPDGIAAIAASAPGVARSSDGGYLIDAVIYRNVGYLTKRNNGKFGYTTIAGVGPQWREMTPSFRLLSGRLPQPGQRELIAGSLAQRKFSGLDAGTTRFGDAQWRVVGTFSTGDWWDGYLVANASELKASANPSVDSAVLVRLTSPQAFEAFRRSIATRLPATLTVHSEVDYYAGFWQSIPKAAKYLIFIVCAVIAAGVIAGVTLIMQNALEERRREIATLRMLGFDPIAVATSAVLEALLFALLGSLAGTALAWSLFDGFLYNGAWNVFRVTVNLHLLLIAAGWGASIVMIGTLPLVIRILRQTELEAIQALRIADLVELPPTRHGPWLRRVSWSIAGFLFRTVRPQHEF
jgi:putative ABC transport system permease protein